MMPHINSVRAAHNARSLLENFCRSTAHREESMDNLSNRGQPDRSKINMHEAHEVKYWTHELGVSKDELQKVVDKVGSSAAAVRKELSH